MVIYNLKSVQLNPGNVEDKLLREVREGHLAGAFSSPPF